MPIEALEERRDFIAALQACRKMKEGDDRQQVIDGLPETIWSRIKYFGDARSHIGSIVTACVEIPGGIDLLLEQVSSYDKGSAA